MGLEEENFNAVVGLMMCIQEGSKEAFSEGDLSIHKIYLEMGELLKQIYLSYQSNNWLFPSNVLLYIPLRYLMDILDDIKGDMRKVLFEMVEGLGVNREVYKVRWNGKRPERVRV